MFRAALVVLVVVSAAAQSSYEELLAEDQAGLTVLQKNARMFLRFVEQRKGAHTKLTEEQMRDIFESRIKRYRDLEQEDGQVQVDAIRAWVRSVAPGFSEKTLDGMTNNMQGPLHLVMRKASEFLGRDHIDDDHPYLEAKKIVVGMRDFTQEIVSYYRERERELTNKEEL